MKEIIEIGKVLNIASDGRGIVRKENLVTFIPCTAQGDLIQYRILQIKKKFALGALVDVLEASVERTLPTCPYYGTCGGCQLQHIRYDQQLEHKRIWVEDALRKIGKFADISLPPVVRANLQWSYRRRIHLVLKSHQNGFQAGYIAVDHKSLVAVNSCPIFTESQDPIFTAIQSICCQLIPSDSSDGKVTLLKSDGGYIVHFHFRVMPHHAPDILSASLNAYPFIIGILATSQRQSLRFGVIEASCMVNGLSFQFTPKAFIQNHPEQSANIYQKILAIALAVKPLRILDLYCGVGITSVLLGQLGCQVLGVELNAEAVKLATSNAQKNHVAEVRFLAADVEKVLARLLKKEAPNFIIVNPPREGLTPLVAKLLASYSGSTILYISCMPSTLARDLHLLCQYNYRLVSAEAFDMFPQTVHVETLVVLHNIA